jgi:hypothetical protein
MPWKSVAVVAVLVLGAAPMTTRTAFARGLAGGAHFGAAHFGGSHFAGGGIAGPRPAIGRGFADRRFAIGRRFAAHRFVIRRGFGRAFGGNFSAGGLWPYDPLWTGAYGGVATAAYPGAGDVAPEPIAVPVCRRSEQIVRVPAEAGGTREIKITNCPQGL